MNKQELIEKYEKLEGVCKDPGAEIARLIFLEDLRELDEPQKVTVPQFVSDWIKQAKEEGYNIAGAIHEAPKGEVDDWLELENVDIFAEAWVNGYHIAKEKRYLVKMKGNIYENILVYGFGVKRYFFSSRNEGNRRAKHTLKELEKDDFGWVFDCPGIEIEEVE